MKKIISLALAALMLTAALTACGKNNHQSEKTVSEETSSKTEKGETPDESKATEETTEKKDNNTDASEPSGDSADAESLYLTYVLGKTVSAEGVEVVFLLDQIDLENWQVPVDGAQPGDGYEFERVKVLGIDWYADGTIEQVSFGDFTYPNTFGTMEAPGTSGTLNVISWGYDPGSGESSSEKWTISASKEEVQLTGENGMVYYFYENHYGV